MLLLMLLPFVRQVKLRLIPQLIKSISRVLQQLLKYFNGTIISTSFVLQSAVLPVVFLLNINEALLLLAGGKLAIAPLASKNGSSL